MRSSPPDLPTDLVATLIDPRAYADNRIHDAYRWLREDPFTFRSDRKPNRHLAFGYGAHLCLGQYLAKMEMRILFEKLLPCLKSIALDGEVTLTQATFVNGPKKLPIPFELN